MSKVVPSLEGVNEGMKIYSLADVTHHCTPEDCWVVIHGFVYDVSKYLAKHPGGPNLVMKNAGMNLLSFVSRTSWFGQI